MPPRGTPEHDRTRQRLSGFERRPDWSAVRGNLVAAHRQARNFETLLRDAPEAFTPEEMVREYRASIELIASDLGAPAGWFAS